MFQGRRNVGYPTFPAVFVVEGEKDADNLAKLGLRDDNPMGAGKWRKEYAEHLRGRDVVILPDNDEPGRAAKTVADSLRGVAAKVRLTELPDLPDKGDVSDWLAAGGTKDKLLELVKAASYSSAERKSTPWPDPVPASKLSAGEKLDWIVEGLIARKHTTLFQRAGEGRQDDLDDLRTAVPAGRHPIHGPGNQEVPDARRERGVATALAQTAQRATRSTIRFPFSAGR